MAGIFICNFLHCSVYKWSWKKGNTLKSTGLNDHDGLERRESSTVSYTCMNGSNSLEKRKILTSSEVWYVVLFNKWSLINWPVSGCLS